MQVAIFILIVIFMANLSPLVDAILHPEIPYFDGEHLIVGGINGVVSILFFGLLLFHIRRLNKAMEKINKLEMFLPICSNCKRIRIPDSDPDAMESWRQIESYISEKTTTQFSHGICPECFEKYYANPKNGTVKG
ncbi:MAG: hypothetical protein C3F14_00625 [Deltaproteobacteria bacterium]|nr:MAG: hypothetical protein C3F14_00625 [Deltaproteobacteria bacterium]